MFKSTLLCHYIGAILDHLDGCSDDYVQQALNWMLKDAVSEYNTSLFSPVYLHESAVTAMQRVTEIANNNGHALVDHAVELRRDLQLVYNALTAETVDVVKLAEVLLIDNLLDYPSGTYKDTMLSLYNLPAVFSTKHKKVVMRVLNKAGCRYRLLPMSRFADIYDEYYEQWTNHFRNSITWYLMAGTRFVQNKIWTTYDDNVRAFGRRSYFFEVSTHACLPRANFLPANFFADCEVYNETAHRESTERPSLTVLNNDYMRHAADYATMYSAGGNTGKVTTMYLS